jgi:hypothetical protein
MRLSRIFFLLQFQGEPRVCAAWRAIGCLVRSAKVACTLLLCTENSPITQIGQTSFCHDAVLAASICIMCHVYV